VTPSNDDEFDSTLFISGKPNPEPAVLPDAVAHYLVMLAGSGVGRRVEIGAEPITIGRDAQQTLVFTDAELSRRHARVSLIDKDAVVEDLRSTNGTFVDNERILTPTRLSEGSVLRLGSQIFRYERRTRRDVERARDLDRDLEKASRYVFSLLPAPLSAGPVHAEWRFLPSAQLGGDAFGYYWLDPDTFVFYLLDVSGHGVGSAMHSVTVLNVLRQRALPHVSFDDPISVLSSLNARFQMDSHSGLFLTIWYGVYRMADRMLASGSAGHHPAYLVPPDRIHAHPLGLPALMIGVSQDVTYELQQTKVPAGSSLYLFSDGAFEIVTKGGERWSLSDFVPLLLEPPVAGLSEAERILGSVRQTAGGNPLEDDVSLLVLSFP
jgi:serine phosphatase RsbU (regulator of sigma subunit)